MSMSELTLVGYRCKLHSHLWIYQVMYGYTWLLLVMGGYTWLCLVMLGYTWLYLVMLGIAWDMHGLECLDFQLMLATCLEVRKPCYSIKKLPLIAGPCSSHS